MGCDGLERMTPVAVLIAVGVLVGVTTVLFGFGGGFVTVPIIALSDAALGGDALRVATATSALVMLVNAAVATASTRRDVLERLHGRSGLFTLLIAGGAAGAAVARIAPDMVLRWGFVLYVGMTVIDLVARPGFIRQRAIQERRSGMAGDTIRTPLGLPIGAVAAFLGVGGSIMTVPMMRRSGASMPVATALANPLTLAIAAPAVAVTLLTPVSFPTTGGLVGAIDVRAALALLAGAMPVIVILRRRPPRIPAALHAWGYIALLTAAGVAVACA